MASYLKPVVFKLGDEYYGVDINSVRGIEKEMSIVPVPNSVSYVKGIINLRGEVIPVVSLKRKFNMQDDAVSGSNLIIVKVNNISVALDVDEVNEINDIAPSDIVEMPSLIKTSEVSYFDRVANHGGKLIVLIDIDYLLTTAEQEAMQSMTEELQK
ncbi:MAG: chemotaxis protein CheW [Bacteroides sp.]|nr:chemotaxis protein CheW [Clostridia bacterium]